MTPIEQLRDCPRLLIKTIMGNTIPIVWLFLLQPLFRLRFDGWTFWLIYGIVSLVASFGMWYANRTVPDPTYKTTSEAPTPILGVVAATFPPIVFILILGVYRMTIPP